MQRNRYKRPNNKKFTTHHLLQKCDGGSNHPSNLVKMDGYEHMALHILFGEDYTLPIDKIEMILHMHRPVLCLEFVSKIQEILDYWKKQGKKAYKQEALSRRCRLKCPKKTDDGE